MEKEIDYYGDKDNYIHLKFGDVRKMFNFTPDFRTKYNNFVVEYTNYFMDRESKFKTPFAVIEYVYKNKIPVHFYYNFTDTPAKSYKEIESYLEKEN